MLTSSRPFKKRIPRRVHSSGFAAELRDLLGLYDMELVFNDEEANDPKDFLTKQEDDSYTINFRPFNWKPRRAKALHHDELNCSICGQENRRCICTATVSESEKHA